MVTAFAILAMFEREQGFLHHWKFIWNTWWILNKKISQGNARILCHPICSGEGDLEAVVEFVRTHGNAFSEDEIEVHIKIDYRSTLALGCRRWTATWCGEVQVFTLPTRLRGFIKKSKIWIRVIGLKTRLLGFLLISSSLWWPPYLRTKSAWTPS